MVGRAQIEKTVTDRGWFIRPDSLENKPNPRPTSGKIRKVKLWMIKCNFQFPAPFLTFSKGIDMPWRKRIKAIPIFCSRSQCNHPLRAAGSGTMKANKTTPNNPRMNPFVLIQFPKEKLAAVVADGGRGRLENCSPSDTFISKKPISKSGIESFKTGQLRKVMSSQSRTRRLSSDRFRISQWSPAPSAAVKRISVFGQRSPW